MRNVFSPCTAELLWGSWGILETGNAQKPEIPGSAYNLHWLETLNLNTFQFVEIKLLYDPKMWNEFNTRLLLSCNQLISYKLSQQWQLPLDIGYMWNQFWLSKDKKMSSESIFFPFMARKKWASILFTLIDVHGADPSYTEESSQCFSSTFLLIWLMELHNVGWLMSSETAPLWNHC